MTRTGWGIGSIAAFIVALIVAILITLFCLPKLDPATHPNDYTVISITILRDNASRAYDAPTYAFTASGVSGVIKGWSVNETHLNDVLCPLPGEFMARAIDHCPTSGLVPMDPSWIGTITEESR